MNILNGDSAASSFKLAFKVSDDDTLIFHDVLSCGPLHKFDDLETWQKARESYWFSYDARNDYEVNPFKKLTRDFYHNFPSIKTILDCKVWIGTGLSDQLLLAFTIYLYDKYELDFDGLSIYQFEEYKSGKGITYPVQGVGLLRPEQIQNHPKPYQLSIEQIEYAKLAWEAFTDTSPKQFLGFMDSPNEALPLLKQAMFFVYHRYPHITDGLCLFDQVLLKNAAIYGSKATRVIGNTMADTMDGLDYVGDNYLYGRLKSLASPELNKPLVKIHPRDGSMRETRVEITEFGHAVLEKKDNAIQENGINDWVGGVNLSSSNHCIWVRDGLKLLKLENK